MKVLVGFVDDAGGREALAVGSMIAGGDALVVCTVVPERWGYPSLARVDAEYEAFLRTHAEQTLQAARTLLGARPADYLPFPAASIAQGLIEAAAREGAELIVLGATRDTALDRLVTGYATEALLHCAPLPVAITPRAGAASAARVSRISVAFSGDPRAAGTVQRAAAVAQAAGLPLRIVTMVVRDRQMYPSPVGYDAEDLVANAGRVQAAEAQRAVREALPPGLAVDCALGDGPSWRDALDSLAWLPGELLLLGSSPLSAVERVFLGSNAKHILHAAPVPVVVLPRTPAVPDPGGTP